MAVSQSKDVEDKSFQIFLYRQKGEKKMFQRILSRVFFSFVAGFVSVVVFHQAMLAILNWVGFATIPPYQMVPTKPFGIPQLWSLAFWGGIWGIGLATVIFHLLPNNNYWLTALIFGALAPTSVFLFIVAPLKGLPIAGGGQISIIVTDLLVNAAWGIGTALLLRLQPQRSRRSRIDLPQE
jgi:hypothetical protein